MELQAQLEQEVKEHNELHTNIQAGEEQLEAMKQDKARRLGRIQVLQELLESDNQIEEVVAQRPDSEVDSMA